MADHSIKYRPILGGISGMSTTQGNSAGTLGLIVRDAINNSVVALTNNHCAGLLYDPAFKVPTGGVASIGSIPFVQPSLLDGGTEANDRIGFTSRAVPIQFGTDSVQENKVDAAIISLDLEIEANEGILDVDQLEGFSFLEKTGYGIGGSVFKSGRTSGFTPALFPSEAATITQKYANINIEYGSGDENTGSFVDQIIVESDGAAFSLSGDSGSVLLRTISDKYYVIGLCFAGSEDGVVAVANHIEDVVDELSISPLSEFDSVVLNQVASNSSIALGMTPNEKLGQLITLPQKALFSKISFSFDLTEANPLDHIYYKCSIREAILFEDEYILDLSGDPEAESEWVSEDDIALTGSGIFSFSSILRLSGRYWFILETNKPTYLGRHVLCYYEENASFSNKIVHVKNGIGIYDDERTLTFSIIGKKYFSSVSVFADIEESKYITTIIKDESS